MVVVRTASGWGARRRRTGRDTALTKVLGLGNETRSTFGGLRAILQQSARTRPGWRLPSRPSMFPAGKGYLGATMTVIRSPERVMGDLTHTKEESTASDGLMR